MREYAVFNEAKQVMTVKAEKVELVGEHLVFLDKDRTVMAICAGHKWTRVQAVEGS